MDRKWLLISNVSFNHTRVSKKKHFVPTHPWFDTKMDCGKGPNSRNRNNNRGTVLINWSYILPLAAGPPASFSTQKCSVDEAILVIHSCGRIYLHASSARHSIQNSASLLGFSACLIIIPIKPFPNSKGLLSSSHPYKTKPLSQIFQKEGNWFIGRSQLKICNADH